MGNHARLRLQERYGVELDGEAEQSLVGLLSRAKPKGNARARLLERVGMGREVWLVELGPLAGVPSLPVVCVWHPRTRYVVTFLPAGG